MSENGQGDGLRPASFALRTEMEIAGQPFEAMLAKVNGGVVLRAVWRNERQSPFGLAQLMGHFAARLPAFFAWEIVIESCGLTFYSADHRADFKLAVKDYGDLSLNTRLEGENRAYELAFRLRDLRFRLADLPVIGKLVEPGDGLSLRSFGVSYTPGRSLTLFLDGGVVLGGSRTDLPLRYEKELSPAPLPIRAGQTGGGIAAATEEGLDAPLTEVKWFNVQKSFKGLTILRIGFVMEDSKLKLCLDARFTLSVLDLELYEMYVTLSLAGDWTLGFGISGLMVTVDKPPVSIGGGLYKAPHETLYNGKLVLKFGKFALTALGSYGELENGTASFFLYLLLGYPLGGPPCFFVTGLALGFGVNRRFRLPRLEEVPSFPLVAAAMNRPGNGLTPATKPAAALSVLSDWISPSQGDYFVTAGVRFESFGMAESFLLATVEFGSRVRVSLLGLSTVSMPPQVQAGKSPIAYAELALRATISPDEGIFEVVGALTGESYILDRNCRLSGGFAFCLWTKGDHKGDFLITLGGCHHPLFVNTHYPVMDKVGVNWTIVKGLTLVADAYFALTPNCMMAGARLELAYTDGSFRAWVRASMELLLQWKPFFYDIAVSVSIGVSFILIFKRVKLEIGADLHLWGPDFSGKVTIHLHIFDVTIHFGKPRELPQALDWSGFYRDFLSAEDGKNRALRASQGAQLCSVYISDGLLREVETERLYVINPYRLRLTTHSKMPSTRIQRPDGGLIAACGKPLGIVPMGKTALTAEQTVAVSRLKGGQWVDVSGCFGFQEELDNLSPALWGTKAPGVNEPLIDHVLVGVQITPCPVAEAFLLPAADRWYALEELLRPEDCSGKETSWRQTAAPAGTDYRNRKPLAALRDTLACNERREAVLAELERRFHPLASPCFKGLGRMPEAYLNAEPTLRTTGAGMLKSGRRS
ncbi:hypothetical protein Sgly_1349 [Syntrophobotulus glycolicus DSM 8271]|uniref:DUF6603 domain-containing protein n=1 Tax=Syntrophobotulus glycolicus (strain DSM 8271 / FlGlyR) TaxID=645991 RepID=F0SVU8_SYNGF|nr:DUF6603 domain-containing protein [Syntrophobotulus glycolicus]ADY55654.1 hypothetical protein Sgly_1349 [Syntrophobotulus glycolicus DSM 8271]